MKPPSTEARSILDGFKAHESLDDADKQRLLEVIQHRAARGDLPRFDVMPLSPVAPSPSWSARVWAAPLGRAAAGAVLLGASFAAAFGARTLSRAWQHPHAATPLVQAAPPATPTPSDPAPTSAPSEAPDETASPTPPPRIRAKADRATDAPAPAAEATIDEEVRLLKAAQSALRSNNAKEALRILNEHASRFPSSKLSDARAVARMTALCTLGQTGQARQEAGRFLARFPGSPFAERVRNICQPEAHP